MYTNLCNTKFITVSSLYCIHASVYKPKVFGSWPSGENEPIQSCTAERFL